MDIRSFYSLNKKKTYIQLENLLYDQIYWVGINQMHYGEYHFLSRDEARYYASEARHMLERIRLILWLMKGTKYEPYVDNEKKILAGKAAYLVDKIKNKALFTKNLDDVTKLALRKKFAKKWRDECRI